MSNPTKQMWIMWPLVAALSVLLGACGKQEHTDLKQELAALTRDVRGKVAPLPQAKPHEPASYRADSLVDPFVPGRIAVAQAAGVGGGGVQPDQNRPKEPLESFPLEQLKIVGLLSQSGKRHAVVQADGKLYQVRKGNYIGQNFGVITDITSTELRIQEIVQDSGGDWVERGIVMPLGQLAEPQRILPADLEQVVPILFATNRKKSGLNHPDRYFLAEEADSRGGSPLTLGRAMVSVPRSHRPGIVEQPDWIRVTLEKVQPSAIMDFLNIGKFKAEDPRKHFTFALAIEELTESAFRNDLTKLLSSSKERTAILYVHGYANSFKDAAFRTAQLSFDLRLEKYDAVPILFSWPSDPDGVNYLGAKDQIRSAGWNLATMLDTLVTATGVGVVHIIAHSMGADVLAVALSQIGEANLVAAGRDGVQHSKFNQIVLAAPDIKATDFKTVIAPAVASRHRITVYASSNDGALRLSRRGNKVARAGDTEHGLSHLVGIRGIEAIDASKVNNELFGHSYFAQSRPMILDLKKLLHAGASPGARGLTPIRRATSIYWEFP